MNMKMKLLRWLVLAVAGLVTLLIYAIGFLAVYGAWHFIYIIFLDITLRLV